MRPAFLAVIPILAALPSFAEAVNFNAGWKEQRFSLFSSNDYKFGATTLGVVSDGSVSLAYAPNTESLWRAKSVSWNWAVSQGVPPTDLRTKGGDDRNLAFYTIFLPEADAKDLKGKSVRRLLRSDAVRVITYVWGGNHSRGEALASPYLGNRGKTIVLRPSGTGSHSESVDLARDYKRAFGGEVGALVGFAVSADSDDTDSVIKGSISNLVVK